MAKRTERARGIATRMRLTDIARRVIAEEGEEAVSLVCVAERAGVTRGTVYHHFRKRDELIRAASEDLERTMEEVAAGTWQHENPYGEPAVQAAQDPILFRAHLRQVLADGAMATPGSRTALARFAEFARDGRLQDDVDPLVGGMLAFSAELAAFMVMETARTEEEKESLIRRFSITYHRMLFHGILNPDVPGWPPRVPGNLDNDAAPQSD